MRSTRLARPAAEGVSIQAGPERKPEGRQKETAVHCDRCQSDVGKGAQCFFEGAKEEKEIEASKLAIGFEQLANQFAKGDRHARRDVFELAEKFGIDLLAGRALVPERVEID